MSVRDLIERRKQGATGGAPSTPSTPAPAKKPASSAVARLIEQKKSLPVVKPQPATPTKPLRETPYSFGASNELLGITPQLNRQKLAEAQYRSEQIKGAKDQLGIKRGFFKQYSHDVNELMASANRGIGDTAGMFGKALTFLGKANDDKGLWKYYSKTGEFLSRANEGYAEVFKTKDSEAINTILENDPFGAMAYKEFWVNKVPQTLVPSVALALPSMGVGGAVMGGAPTLGKAILATTAGSLVSRPIESASEAGDTYTTMLERGASEEEAMKSAQEVFAGNMKLVGVDAVQLALALTPFKSVLGKNPTFLSKLAYGTIATSLGSASEGAEELYQLYVQKKAQDDEFDMFGNEAQQSFILGVIGGLAFQGVGFAVSPREKKEAEEDYVNKIIDKLPPDQKNQFTDTQKQEEKVDMLEAIAKTNDYVVTDAVRAVDKEYLDTLDGTKKADQLEMLEPEVITAIQNGQTREEIALQLNNQGVAIQDALDLVDRLVSATPQTTTSEEIDATLLEKTASQLKKEQDTATKKSQSEITQIKTDIAKLQKNITATTDANQKATLKKDLATKREALKTAETALQEDTVRSATGLRALVEQQVRDAGVTDGRIVDEVIVQITSGRGSVPIREVIADAIRSAKPTKTGVSTQPPKQSEPESKSVKEVKETKKTAETKDKKDSKSDKRLEEDTKKDKKPAKTTQKDKVKKVVEKKGKASIKEIAERVEETNKNYKEANKNVEIEPLIQEAKKYKSASESKFGVRFGEEVKDRAIQLYKEGKSSTQISKEMGISSASVLSWTEKAGIKRTISQSKVLYEKDIPKVIELYKQGKNTTEISKELNLVPSSVARWVKEAGIMRSNSEAQSILAELGKTNVLGVRSKVSTKFGVIPADSTYEAIRIKQLEADPNIVSIKRATRIPFGENRHYVPDIEIKYKNGSTVIEEIKPVYKLGDEKIIAKEKAAKEFYKDKNTEYRIITENDIGVDAFKNANLDNITFGSEEIKLRFLKAINKAKSKTKQQLTDIWNKANEYETTVDKLPENKQNKDNETSNDTRSDDNEGGTPEPVSNESKRPRTPKDPASRPNGKDRNKDNGADDSDTGVRSSDPIRERVTNEEIEAKVAELVSFDEGKAFLNIRAGEITDEVRDMVSQYQSGGVAKEGRGILDEYYTKGEIVSAIKGLLDFPARGLKVLEPSIGTGNFLYALPQIGSHNIDGYEINATTAGIAKILHPDATIYNKSFESEFIDERGNKKDFTERYDLVIGNPPYGEHRGEYLGLGEEPKIKKYEDYFVKRSIDVLKEGGTLAMVLPSSWLNRSNLKGATLESAYRLPNGAFEGTDIGTDIVILRKDKSGTVIGKDYFNQNPQNVLGEEGVRQNRFGRDESYVEGTLEDALSRLDNAKNETEAIKILKELNMPVTEENVIEVAEVVDQAGKGAKAVVKAEKREKTEVEKKGEKTIETKVKKVSTVKGETMSINIADLTPEMETLWRMTQQDGSLFTDLTDAELVEKYGDSINYVGGKWYLDFNYAQGDIYEKLALLESDYRDKKFDKARYEAQKTKLNAVLPVPETVADMKLTPNMQFVKDFKMGMDANGNEITMATDFRSWLQKLPRGAFGTSNLWEIQAYVQNEQVRGQDKKYNERVRERRKRMADSLFAKYLNEGLEPEMRTEFENRYNQTFNFFHTPDYSQVPLFGKINSVFEGQPFEPNRAQRKGIGRLMNTGVGILAHEVGFGKAQPLHSAVLTPTGWKKMGKIKVGDTVFAGDGTPTTVLGVYPQGVRPVYKITFSDGSFAECDENHLWKVKSLHQRSKDKQAWQILDTKTIKKVIGKRNRKRQFSIPITQVQFEKRKLKIAPYLLGVLLGDGGIKNSVVVSSSDQEILKQIEKKLPVGLSLKHASRYDYRISTGNVGGTKNQLKEDLKQYGLFGKGSENKFIPEDYLMSDVFDRIDLLRGLMDTDGFVSKNGFAVQFCTTSKKLSDNFTSLVQSLGGVTFVNTKIPYFNKKRGKLCYIITLSLPPEINPFLLTRKAERVTPKTKYKPTRYIDSIEFLRNEKTQCISVEHSDHTYITDNYIVTHNTISGVLTAYEAMQRGWAKRPLIVVPNDNVASQWIDKTIMGLIPDAKVNFLGNLGANFKGDLSSLKIEEGSFTVVTYEGLKRLSFTDATYERMALKFNYLADELGKDKTKRELEKEKAEMATSRGKMKKGTRADLTFESLGFDHLTFDECFVKGTQVLTKDGYKNIENIQLGDTVVNATGFGTVTNTFKRKSSSLVVVTLTNGQRITVTSNHPFLTDNGWIKASDLSCGQGLFSYRQTHSIVTEYEKDTTRLSTDLPNLREDVHKEPTAEPIEIAEKLFDGLFSYYGFKKLYSDGQGAFTQTKMGEKTQSEPIGTSESDGDKESDSDLRTPERWKWNRSNETAGVSARSSWERLVSRASGEDSKKEGTRVSDVLQVGHSEPNKNDSDRSGRAESQHQSSETTGLQETAFFKKVRVESIEVYEPTSDEQLAEGVDVYNLEVSEHHSYVVGDVVVHNCHNANHVVGKVKLKKGEASEFNRFGLMPSALGIKTWLASQYIQEQNNGRNVTLLSATPFTNHPLEYYSILSMVADKSLEKMGFRNVNEFFSAFMEASNEFEFKADGSYDKKTDIRSFKNYRQFRKLLDSFIDFEQDSPDIIRPNRIQKSYEIPKNDIVREMEDKAQQIFTENENESGKGAKILRAISELQLIAISPYLSQFSAYKPAYKEFVENSPKLDVVIQLIAQNKKDRPDAGQIIYSQKGVEIFPYLRDYLVKEVGFKPEEVAIIVGGSGSVSPKKRVEIQKDFNAGKIKVLIGSDTITEGMNLQINTTDMHLLSLPWNFTALRQVIGRAWRQQNTWKNVRINQYFMQDSVDVFMSQKLDNKQRRYENAIKSNANEVDVGDVSYNEFKFDLVKDPEARAKLELQSKKEDLNLAIQTEQSELAFATRRLEKVNAIDKDLKSSQEGLDREMARKPEERNEYWVTRYGQEVVKYQKDLDEAIEFLKERGVSVDSLLATKKKGELKVESLQKELKSLEETFAERVKELKENAIEPPLYTREVAQQFVAERAIENKDFYQKANQPKAETVSVKRTPKARVEPATVLNPEPEVKKTKKTVVTKKKTVRESKNKDARVMAILAKPDLTVAEKVTEILDTKQEGKKFKDVGERVSGSKKERATIRTVFENADADVIAEMIRTLGGEAVAQTHNKAEILEDAIVPNYEADQKNRVPAMVADWKMRVLNNITKVPVLVTKRSKYRNIINVNTADIPRFLTEYPELLRTFVEELANVSDAVSAKAFSEKYQDYLANFASVDAEGNESSYTISIGVLGKSIEKIIRESYTLTRLQEEIVELKEILRKGAFLDKAQLESVWKSDHDRAWKGLSYTGRTTHFENEAEAKRTFDEYKESAQERVETLEKKYQTGYDLYQKKKTPALEGVDLSHGNFEEIKVYDRKGIVPAERINVETLTKELGFKSVQLGNYMDDSSAKQHIEQAITAVEDVSRALKIDFAKIFNQRGLSIAFGARGGGRFNAHFEPSQNIINLTKNRGDGSFWHELFHFLDYKYNRNSHRETWSSKKTRFYRDNPIEKVTLDLMDAITGRRIKKEVTLQPQDDSYVLNSPENEIMRAYADGKTFDEAIQIAKRMRYAESQTLQWVADVYRKPVTDTITAWNERTDYYKESLKVGGGSTDSYWVRPQELLARAGQSYLEDKLKEAGIKNSYVTRPTEGIKHYPQGAERKVFNELFDKVFAIIAREYPLVSETEKVVDENQNFVARFKGKSESQTVVGASYALPYLRDVKKRLQIDFNVRFVDTILANESAQKNKPPLEAWGAVMDNTVVLARDITRWTAQHETGHLIFNNLDRLKAFTRRGITKKALVDAKVAELRAKGVSKIGDTVIVGRIGVKETLAVEEQIMVDFEEYLENRYQPSAGLLKRFYLALKRMVMDFAKMFKADPNIITDFYDLIDSGYAIDGEGAILETAGILDEYLKDRREGVVSYKEAEMLMGGARFKLRQEPDKVLQKIQQQYNDTESALTQKQEELEKIAVEMDTAIEQTGRLAEIIEETPENVKELKRNTTRKPPVVLTEAGVAKVDEYGFANKEEAEQAITAYIKNKTELLETRNQLAKIRRQIATLKRGSKLDKSSLRDIERKLKMRKSFLEKKSYYIEIGRGQGAKEQMRIIRKRGQVLNQLQDMIGLSDARAKTLIGELTKQKMHLMSEKEFDDFLIHFTNRGTELANKLFEQQEVQAMIQEKQLQKTENLRKAMGLPPVTKMKAEQASLFARALSEYEFGDTFLSQRQLETIHRTDWTGAKTEREMFETIFEDTGISKEDMQNVTVSGDFQKFKNWLVLSRSNPLFSWLVDKRFKAELETQAKLVAFEEELNPVVKKARASRKKPFVERIAQAIAPMDELVFGYIEAENKEEYRVTNEMTTEEVELAHFLMTRLFLPAKDYMSSEYAMATRDNYITHIRRGVGETFITAMKEGKSVPKAVVEAVSEIFSAQKEDEVGFGILAGKTSEIVAFEKWFQFAMPRSGNLIPSKNVAKASLAYARAYYKKQAVDRFVPEAMILATIQEKVVGETKKGLAINPKVRQFINEFVNDTKGRKIDFVTEQGSKADNAIRLGIMWVAFKYLGFRPVLGLANFIGEFVGVLRATTTKEKWRGLKRSIELGRAKDVNEKYRFFTGRNPITELFDPQHELPQRLVQTALVLFSLGSFFNNRFYIRAKMTEEEWQNALMSDERMVTITKEMSKWRKTPFYIKSLAGNTAVSSMFTQFATWAIPIVTTTLSDTQQLYKEIQKSGVKEGITSEHAQELGKTIATIGTLYFIAMAISSALGDEDERDIWFYVARELNTMYGAFGVMFDLETRMLPPLVGQLIDLMTVFEQLLKMETYKRDGVGYSIGDLKAWNTLERLVMPSAIKDISEIFNPAEKENTKVRMINEAIQSGDFKPEEIAEKTNPDEWNNTKGERSEEKQKEYQEKKVLELTMEYNLRKKYPDSKVAEIILTVNNNEQRVAKMIELGEELGQDTVYNEFRQIYRDRSVCGNPREQKVCPVSDQLFKSFREAQR